VLVLVVVVTRRGSGGASPYRVTRLMHGRDARVTTSVGRGSARAAARDDEMNDDLLQQQHDHHTPDSKQGIGNRVTNRETERRHSTLRSVLYH
jgi:hypothetical protein